MDNLKESIDLLIKETNKKPEVYWIKDGKYIFKTTSIGKIGCDYYIVDGNKVLPTNPMRSNLTLKEANIL